MVGFSRSELESFRDATLNGLIPADLKLLIVGINPGLWSAATQTHFAYPGNRFYPALRLAGITERDLAWSSGMPDSDRDYLAQRGLNAHETVASLAAAYREPAIEAGIVVLGADSPRA